MSWQKRRAVGLRSLWILLVMLAFGVGCSKGCGRSDSGEAGASASASAAAKPPPLSIDRLTPPPAALVYGGVDNVSDLAASMKSFAGAALPAGFGEAELMQLLKQGLALQNAGGIESGGPVRFALFDPKQHSGSSLFVVKIKSKDQFVASLPPGHQASDAGAEFAYPGGGATRYVNFLSGSAVVTEDASVFGKYREFIEQLAEAPLPAKVALVASVQNSMKLYGAEVEANLAQVKQQMQAMQQLSSTGGPGAGAQQAAQAAAIMDWMVGAARELDRVVVTGAVAQPGAQVAIRLQPKPGTELEKTFGLFGSTEFKLLESVPADSPLLLAFGMDPDRAGDLSSRIVRWSLSLGLGGLDLPQQFVDATQEYWKATTGESVFFVHKAPSGDGVTWSALYGLRDGEKAHSAYRTMMAMYQDPEVKKLFKSLGMKVETKPDAYRIGDVSVDMFSLDMGPNTLGALGAAGPLRALLDNLTHTHVSMNGKLGIVAYGAEAKTTLEGLLSGNIKGGAHQTLGVVQALKAAPKGCFMLLYLRPAQLAQSASLGGQNPFAAAAAALPPTTSGIALTASASDRSMVIALDVPGDQVAPLMQLTGLLAQGLLRPGLGAAPGALPGRPPTGLGTL